MFKYLKPEGIIYGIAIIFLFSSCSLGGGTGPTLIYYKPTLYEYNIEKKTYSKITDYIESTGYYDQVPDYFDLYYQYLPKDNNKIVFVSNYTKITILDTKSKKRNEINLDSLAIIDSYISVSPIQNKIAFEASNKNENYSTGLYTLDLDTRKIHTLNSADNDPIGVKYGYYNPTFSNNGNLLTYVQCRNYYNKDSVKNPWIVEYSISNIDLTTNNRKIICPCSEYIYYSQFDKTDSNLIFAIGTYLLKINLASSEIDTIDNIHREYDYGVGFPQFLLTSSSIFYSRLSKAMYPQGHQLFVCDILGEKSTFLIEGYMPMSENSKDGNILIRGNSNIDDIRSPIEIINVNGKIEETLKSGVRAIFSPDGDNVLLLVLEISSIDP